MHADANPRTSPAQATTASGPSIDGCLGTLRALLRLVDPQSPFQPILLSSINIHAWLALFGRAARQLGGSIRKIPDTKCRGAVLEAFKPFLRLADTLCEHADLHAFPPGDGCLDDVPEMATFSPDSAVCKEDGDAIAAAIDTAARAFAASTAHRNLLRRTLALAARKLKKSLDGPNGLLRLIKRRCRTSRPFSRRYAEITDGLKAALNRLPDPEATPWEKCQIRFAEVCYQLEKDLLSQLDPIIKEVCSSTPRTPAEAKQPEALKTTTLQAVTAFLEVHGLARGFDRGLLAVQYHTLFDGLLAPVTAALRRCGPHRKIPSTSPRIIDDIRRLSPDLIARDVLASWDASLPETDLYATEVVLAALHHLERPVEGGDGSAGKDHRIFGFSDGDLAGWVRRGTYVGADPCAEASTSRAAETKRAGRTLQHLRRVGAAFHDRRQWTPTHARNVKSTQHRLWTVNPLLALMPRIAARLENGTLATEKREASVSPESRPRPSRRNRGTRPRARD